MWLRRQCHRFGSVFWGTFTTPSGFIAISGYNLLYLCPLPILKFPQLIIHTDSFRVVLYPSSASMPTETRILFSVGTCRTWCRVIMLSFGSWMGTSPVPKILHSLLPVAESYCVACSGRIVRKPFNVRGHVKCGARIQQSRMCVLRTVVDFSYRRVL